MALNILLPGIPIIYYGTEQNFNGGMDPLNREPLWISNFNTNSKLYQFISLLNYARKIGGGINQAIYWKEYSNNYLSFTTQTNSDILVILTSNGNYKIVIFLNLFKSQKKKETVLSLLSLFFVFFFF